MFSDHDSPVPPDADVLVIGGGAAGLTAAVTLGRARRSVLVLDSGAPRHAPSDGVHMFLTRDGTPPAEMARVGRDEVRHYGGRLIDAEAIDARRIGAMFEVATAAGELFRARRLVVTTGLLDVLPDLPGLRELWGHNVHHCPYCHGHELHGRSVGVLGTGAFSVHQALMFRQWVTDLVLFRHTAPPLTGEQAEQLAARDIRIVEGPVRRLEIEDGRLTGVWMGDGTVIPCQSLVVGPRFVARSKVLASLGLAPVEHPLGIGEYIAADPAGLTEVPGVWVAGNVADLQAGVVNAASQGMTAAAAVNADLIAEDTRLAVEAYRHRPEHVAGQAITNVAMVQSG